MSHRSAFTLIELLVVVVIVALLSIFVIVALNPPQLFAQSRDSTRLSNMSTLNSAMGIVGGVTSLGSADTVYVSIPDPSATSTAGDQCQGLGLLTLPNYYTYQCASASNYRNVNGTGWVPINFSAAPGGAPFGALPVDPTNTSSSREYYTYTTDGQGHYEFTAVMESNEYKLGGSKDAVGPDGGTLAHVYEKGSELGLEPLDYGDTSLKGYWTFEEGSGYEVYDYSGNNATGTWQGEYDYTAGKVGQSAGAFVGGSGTTDVNGTLPSSWLGNKSFSVIFWFNPMSEATDSQFVEVGDMGWAIKPESGYMDVVLNGNNQWYAYWPMPPLNTWTQYAFTFNGSQALAYLNGALYANYSGQAWSLASNQGFNFGMGSWPNYLPYTGYVDDVRAYTRALSAAEISAMYSDGK